MTTTQKKLQDPHLSTRVEPLTRATTRGKHSKVNNSGGRHSKPRSPRRIKNVAVIALILLSGVTCGASALHDSSYRAEAPDQSQERVLEPAPAPTFTAPIDVPTDAPEPVQEAPAKVEAQVIPVAERPPYKANIGLLTVPRFGNGAKELIQGGRYDELPTGTATDENGCAVIDTYLTCPMQPIIKMASASGGTAVGHYPNSAMPGGVGPKPVAIAGHRGGGDNSPFTYVDELELGDEAYIQTDAGIYTYQYLWQETVAPDNNDVLKDQVFKDEKREAGDEVERALVLTTCGLEGDNPELSGDSSIRVAAYFEFVSFQPA